jgi:hypothetical protein
LLPVPAVRTTKLASHRLAQGDAGTDNEADEEVSKEAWKEEVSKEASKEKEKEKEDKADFECEHDCGFDGNEDAVLKHEQVCNNNPKNATTSNSSWYCACGRSFKSHTSFQGHTDISKNKHKHYECNVQINNLVPEKNAVVVEDVVKVDAVMELKPMGGLAPKKTGLALFCEKSNLCSRGARHGGYGGNCNMNRTNEVEDGGSKTTQYAKPVVKYTGVRNKEPPLVFIDELEGENINAMSDSFVANATSINKAGVTKPWSLISDAAPLTDDENEDLLDLQQRPPLSFAMPGRTASSSSSRNSKLSKPVPNRQSSMGTKRHSSRQRGTVRVFRRKFTLEDAIGSHASMFA